MRFQNSSSGVVRISAGFRSVQDGFRRFQGDLVAFQEDSRGSIGIPGPVPRGSKGLRGFQWPTRDFQGVSWIFQGVSGSLRGFQEVLDPL